MNNVQSLGPRNWRAECTHTTMTRVFDADGSIGCSRCGKFATLRWVYVCTEDQNRSLSDEFVRNLAAPVTSSASTATTATTTTASSSSSSTTTGVSLNEWVSKAIEDGHYTEAEAETLRAQRAGVIESIRMESTRSEEEKEMAQAAAEAFRRSVVTPPGLQGMTREDDLRKMGYCPPPAATAAIPRCVTSYCHPCRPSSCERSWQSLVRLCSKEMEVSDKGGNQIQSISDIPMSDICRQIPRYSTRDSSSDDDEEEEDNDDSDVEMVPPPPVPDPAILPNPNSNDNDGETYNPFLEELRASWASLQNSQHWSRFGLQQSLSPVREERPKSPKTTQDHIKKGWASLPKRPRLTRRSKFTAEQIGPLLEELAENTNLSTPSTEEAKTPEGETEMEMEKTEEKPNEEMSDE
ncbi:hypothetical protein FQN49_000904 [Arthroderma sp. PD_2]|nr:hypothetical protein FQN49_000904 [Arthroderma sp. PD_2]